ncbi:hypothetical protein BC829DRAFT_423477 [Chytridium lagenaria]|nr:hypothetical protein BC829DRAFT_423477 [Chytridium lagenaria]
MSTASDCKLLASAFPTFGISETACCGDIQSTGVGCDPSTGRINWIQFNQRGVRAPIPPQLSRLTGLEILDLSQNQLTGPIPPELSILNVFKGFGRTIPSELKDLNNLIDLSLSNNRLTGSIPQGLGVLINERFTTIYVDNNYLTGTIPQYVAEMINRRISLNCFRPRDIVGAFTDSTTAANLTSFATSTINTWAATIVIVIVTNIAIVIVIVIVIIHHQPSLLWHHHPLLQQHALLKRQPLHPNTWWIIGGMVVTIVVVGIGIAVAVSIYRRRRNINLIKSLSDRNDHHAALPDHLQFTQPSGPDVDNTPQTPSVIIEQLNTAIPSDHHRKAKPNMCYGVDAAPVNSASPRRKGTVARYTETGHLPTVVSASSSRGQAAMALQKKLPPNLEIARSDGGSRTIVAPEVGQWLSENGLASGFIEIFKAHNVDGYQLLLLTPSRLFDIGITVDSMRSTILFCVEQLRDPNSAAVEGDSFLNDVPPEYSHIIP